MRLLLSALCSFVVMATIVTAEPVQDVLEQTGELLPQREDLAVMEECIELYEEALSLSPGDPELLVMLAQLWHEHSRLMEHEEHNADQRMESLKKAADYACQAMGLGSCVELERMSVDEMESHLAEVDNPAALHWAGDSWGKILDENRWHALRVHSVDKLRALYGRLIEVDESHFGAAGHRSLGALEANLATTPLVGGWLGSVDQAHEHFERALELAPEFLMNYLEYADQLARPLGEWELFDELIEHVLQAPMEPTPFWNNLAKRNARELLQREGRPPPPEA
ncbi:MAG: TRAP transporter TatT component family protein [Candidatus Bipolaricaulota bacterium]